MIGCTYSALKGSAGSPSPTWWMPIFNGARGSPPTGNASGYRSPRTVRKALIRSSAPHPGVATRTVRMTLGQYTNSPEYLALLLPRAVRVDPAGEPAGIVTEAQAQRATERLQQRIAERAPARSRAP
jgi:hypothetical protein